MSFEYTRIAANVASYSSELWSDSAHIANIYKNLPCNKNAQKFLQEQGALRVAGMGLMVKQVYDMVHTEDSSTINRQQAAELGLQALLLVDIVDDEVDSKKASPNEKAAYLDRIADHLILGTSYPHDSSAPQDTIYALTQHLHERLRHLHGSARFESFMPTLASVVKEQLTSQDLARQLELVKLVGGYCGEIAIAAVEVVDAQRYPKVAQAAFHIGAYAQCLDNAYEILQDIEEGSLSFATLYAEQNGLTPVTIREIRSILLSSAAGEYKAGEAVLSPEQRRIYKAVKILLECKYKVYGRLKKPDRCFARFPKSSSCTSGQVTPCLCDKDPYKDRGIFSIIGQRPGIKGATLAQLVERRIRNA